MFALYNTRNRYRLTFMPGPSVLERQRGTVLDIDDGRCDASLLKNLSIVSLRQRGLSGLPTWAGNYPFAIDMG